MSEENPFFHNYVFKLSDIHRVKIKWSKYPFLWLKPTYVQITDGYAFHFKKDRYGRIYLMKTEKIGSQHEWTSRS